MKAVSTGQSTAVMSESRPANRLLMVSNRGPLEHYLDGSGRVARRPTDGGVSTALTAIAESADVDWLACASTEQDAALARHGQRVRLGGGSKLGFAALPAQAYDLCYNTFCNPTLWFLQHGIWDQLEAPNPALKAMHAWKLGYLPVNQLVAERVAEALRGRVERVMFHDYHFYVAPLYVRNLHPRACLQHFVHVPWPDPAEWMRLPRKITETICRGLLANDSVVFQTAESAENFLATCDELLHDIHIDFEDGFVTGPERETRVWANPISIDAVELHRRLLSPEAQEAAAAILPELGTQTILRVDRLDPAKNVVAGFEAYEALLERHPEYRGQVKFLAFLQPSRTTIPEYETYAARVMRTIERVNVRFGTPGWQPVRAFVERDRIRALTAMRFFDVLLVNSLADGMNLVSKEGAVLNERDGTVVLSQAAGSYRELAGGALGIDPRDVAGTAEALHKALTMGSEERAERAACLRGAILHRQLEGWLDRQLTDLGIAAQSSEIAVRLPGLAARKLTTLAG
jgi:trehalose 6-phosphate synthase